MCFARPLLAGARHRAVCSRYNVVIIITIIVIIASEIVDDGPAGYVRATT